MKKKPPMKKTKPTTRKPASKAAAKAPAKAAMARKTTSKQEAALHRRNVRTAIMLSAVACAVAASIFYVRTHQPLNDSNIIRPANPADIEPSAPVTAEPAPATEAPAQ